MHDTRTDTQTDTVTTALLVTSAGVVSGSQVSQPPSRALAADSLSTSAPSTSNLLWTQIRLGIV